MKLPAHIVNSILKDAKPLFKMAMLDERDRIIKIIEKQRDKYDQDDMIKYQTLDDIIKKILQ